MNILAFDTCLGALSVSIGRHYSDGRYCVLEQYEALSTGHAERLVPMIETELARAGLTFREIDRIGVTLGPGTFTGVRTGIAVARALRLATGIEVVGLSSLAVMAHRIFEISSDGGAGSGPVMVAVDARRGRLYTQLFGKSALDPITPPSELAASGAASIALEHSAVLAGSGAPLVSGATPDAAALVTVCDDLQPNAGDLVRLAAGLAPLADVSPIYIRPPDAKPQSDKRLARIS